MDKNTENTVTNTDTDKPWLFQSGKSGNPAGKPRGAKNKITMAAMGFLEHETEAITRKAIELALAGDTTALKLCLDRIAPPLKAVALPVNLDMPNCNSLSEIARGFILAASRGELPPDIATQLISAVVSVARVEELEQVKQRLESLELAIKGQR